MTRHLSSYPSVFPSVRAAGLAMLLGAFASAAAADPPAAPSSRSDVVISSLKFDRRTLEQELIPQYVKTHGAPTPLIEQMTRWHEPLCPDVEGLPPAYKSLVTGRISAAAQAAGVPSAGEGKCTNNITIVFTRDPQQLVDSIAREHAVLLGSSRVRGDTTVSRAVQSWYLTGTRQLGGSNNLPVHGLDPPATQGGIGMMVGGVIGTSPAPVAVGGASVTQSGSHPADGGGSVSPDPAWDNSAVPGGVAGSRLGAQLRSELLHVTIIVDTQKLKGLNLGSVSDYVAFLALTRVAAAGSCGSLPSILDLFATDCTSRDKPAALSEADTAFLKALYFY